MSEENICKFSMKTTETEFINLENQDIKLFHRIYFKDSLYEFFPYAEVFVRDIYGLFTEHSFFVEGTVFELKLGNDEDGYLEGKYAWSESQFNDVQMEEHLTGTTVFILISEHFMKDKPKSRAFNDSTSNIVKKIINEDYKITDVSNICDTAYITDWYQMNEENSEFIQNLAEVCHSSAYKNSPIFTFINCKGEFYFTSVEEMFQKDPVATFMLKFDKDSRVDKDVIQDYIVLHGGLPINKENYEKKVFTIDESGGSAQKTVKIEDSLVSYQKGILPIKKEYQKENSYLDIGIIKDEETEVLQGIINTQCRDSALSYRMEIIVHFKHNLLSGKTIELEVGSSDEEKKVNIEFSGRWLILESEHYADESGIPYSKLFIAKSTINLDKSHIFFKDFLR